VPSVVAPAIFGTDLVLLPDVAALKAILTASLPAGTVRDIVSAIPGETRQAWQLYAGVHADDVANGFAQPADYSATTNAKYWQRVL